MVFVDYAAPHVLGAKLLEFSVECFFAVEEGPGAVGFLELVKDPTRGYESVFFLALRPGFAGQITWNFRSIE